MSITPLSPDEVRAFREARGWTQKQAAEAVGVVKRSWETWETRKVDPADPEKGAPPLYLRYAFAAIEAGLEPWVPYRKPTAQVSEPKPGAWSNETPTNQAKVSPGSLLSLPEGARLK